VWCVRLPGAHGGCRTAAGHPPRWRLGGPAVSALALTLQAFFTDRLIAERHASGHTIPAFLAFDPEIRTIWTTNAIESLNARFRRAVKARGHFPTEQAALKYLYLTVVSLDPTGTGRRRWSNRWKAALNAFDITFDGRLSAGRK
jgi:transposase-like protein